MGDLSDKGLAIFAFAAYHQLESGQPVTKVIREDGKGHKADEEGVSELERLGLAKPRATASRSPRRASRPSQRAWTGSARPHAPSAPPAPAASWSEPPDQ
jgi:hypothetical protein